MNGRLSALIFALAWITPAGGANAQAPSAPTLEAMRDRVVFWDDRLDSVGQAQHQDRLVDWLVTNGFRRVKSEELIAWTKGHIDAVEAYGSVAVMPMGYAPAGLAEEPGEGILWLRYLKAGGRIVSVGDLPFDYYEYPEARPLPEGMGDRGFGALGLVGGWNQPYWGRNLEVTTTDPARAWGFETSDGSITGFPVESVTIAFGTYVVPETGKLGATSWLKSLRPDLPGSGLIKMCQFFDGRNDAQLRGIWRAANYAGRPVTVPPMPAPWQAPPTAAVSLRLTASGIAGRTQFARGETVTATVSAAEALQATHARLELAQGGKVLARHEQALAKEDPRPAAIEIKTAPYAYGDYELKVTALKGAQVVGQASQAIGIRHVPEEGFNWHVWVGTAPNPYRRDMIFADIKAAGMEPHLTDLQVEGMDAVLRRNAGFSLRLMPDVAGGKERSYEKNPDFFRLDLERKPIPSAYAGGRPTLGLSQPELLENARKSLRDPLAPVATHPAFRPYVLTNDDFSVYYGWDFSPHVLARFKQATGLDAPTKKEDPPPGVVDENNPWLRWFEFTLREITGGVNRASTQGVTEARRDVRIGPIPGGMQIPYIHMWDAQQYPPLNFGPNGFNLLACYYYNTYWQPVMTNTFWMEIGRMANRDLPEWCMPDLFMTAGYVRNNLFHLLAGGVKGLAYYTYDARNPGTWDEVKHLAPQVRRIGAVQRRLQPASMKDIGLMVSFTTLCFEPTHALDVVYAYENLMQAHLDVEMTCEEEILSGRASQYQAVLLYDARWLRKSVYDALAAHAAKGGLVLLDTSVPFDIPGTKRVKVDLGLGEQRPLGEVSTPNIHTYGDPERIARVQKALSEFVKPRFGCEDMRLVANRFEAGGVPYVWFVNAHTGKEYMFCRERMGAGHPGSGTPEKVAELKAWEQQEMKASPFRASATFAKLPGVPYDLIAGRPVPVEQSAAGATLDLVMERFGGTLVAFLPEPIARVTIAGPSTAAAAQEVRFRVQVLGNRTPLPGALPVAIVLTDPAGASSVLSGVRATENGAVEFAWTPAVNDLKGKWTLTATELASGKTARQAIVVK
jgi:hypothetical protein